MTSKTLERASRLGGYVGRYVRGAFGLGAALAIVVVGCQSGTSVTDPKHLDTDDDEVGASCAEPDGSPLSAQIAGDCKVIVCDGGKRSTVDDDSDVPADGECTVGVCAMGSPSQAPASVGSACAGGAKVCNEAGACVVCVEGAGCAPGTTCFEEEACVSCDNGVRDGSESGVDCGGSCALGCADGQPCGSGADCASGSCEEGACVSCGDGQKNGGEVGVDCGGSCAAKCPDGTACSGDVDCASSICVDGVCCNAECSGTCVSCAMSGSEGVCQLIPKGHNDSSPLCANNKTCDGFGSCVWDKDLKHFGQPCSQGADCFSGVCGAMQTCE